MTPSLAASRVLLVLGMKSLIRECVNSIWKKTLKRFVHDFEGFSKDEEVAKVNRAVTDDKPRSPGCG